LATRQLKTQDTAIIQILDRAGRVGTSLIEATKETQPIVEEVLTELDTVFNPDTVDFFGGYIGDNVETFQKAADHFHETYNCNFNCRGLSGDIKRRCEKKYCNKKSAPLQKSSPK